MCVEFEDLSATVEVYSPVEWEGLDYFKQDAWDTLRQLDSPHDYVFRFDIAQLQPFIGRAYRQLHPEDLARGLDTLPKRQRLLGSLFDGVVDGLNTDAEHVLAEQQDEELNLSLRVELEQVQPLADFEPRPGVLGGPGIGGYRPEPMFRDVIGRALGKAREGQAHTGGSDLAVVIVDVSRLPLESELSSDVYQALFQEILADFFPSRGALPVDLFALCRSRGWRSELLTHYAVWDEERMSRDQCEALLGSLDRNG